MSLLMHLAYSEEQRKHTQFCSMGGGNVEAILGRKSLLIHWTTRLQIFHFKLDTERFSATWSQMYCPKTKLSVTHLTHFSS